MSTEETIRDFLKNIGSLVEEQSKDQDLSRLLDIASTGGGSKFKIIARIQEWGQEIRMWDDELQEFTCMYSLGYAKNSRNSFYLEELRTALEHCQTYMRKLKAQSKGLSLLNYKIHLLAVE